MSKPGPIGSSGPGPDAEAKTHAGRRFPQPAAASAGAEPCLPREYAALKGTLGLAFAILSVPAFLYSLGPMAKGVTESIFESTRIYPFLYHDSHVLSAIAAAVLSAGAVLLTDWPRRSASPAPEGGGWAVLARAGRKIGFCVLALLTAETLFAMFIGI